MFILRFNKIHYLFFLFIQINIFLFGQNANSQIQNITLNKENYEKATKDIDYHTAQKRKFNQLETKKMGYDDVFEKQKIKDENKDNTAFNFWGWAEGLKTLGIIFLVAISCLLLYLFIKNANWTTDKKIEDFNVVLSKVEDNLPEADVETPLERAIKEKNYKVATRLYYLLLIKKLAEQKHIVWNKAKTNREYKNELRGVHFIEHFRQATYLYEKAWFGNEPVTQFEFEDFKPLFDSLIQKIT
jgi:hypothetical protein